MTDTQNLSVLPSDLRFRNATSRVLRERTVDGPSAIFQRGMEGFFLGDVIAAVNRLPNSNSDLDGRGSVRNVPSRRHVCVLWLRCTNDCDAQEQWKRTIKSAHHLTRTR